MTNISSQGSFNSIFNEYSNKIKDPKKKEEFQAKFSSSTFDSDGLTESEIKELGEFFSKTDGASFSSKAKELVGTKFVVRKIEGSISKKDSELMDALGSKATSDSIITPQEAKEALSVKRAKPLSDLTRKKLEEISNIKSDRVYVVGEDVSKERIVSVNRIDSKENVSKKSTGVIIESSSDNRMSLSNVSVVNRKENDLDSSTIASGVSNTGTNSSIKTQVTPISQDKVVPTKTHSINIQVPHGENPEEYVLNEIIALAAQEEALMDSETVTKTSSGAAVGKAESKVVGADDQKDREMLAYTKKLDALGCTRDELTKKIFGESVSVGSKKYGFYVEGLKDNRVTPQGETFIKSVMSVGLLKDKKPPFSKSDFLEACKVVGLGENDITSGRMGAQYITKFQKATVERATSLIDDFNSLGNVLSKNPDGSASVNKDVLEQLLKKHPENKELLDLKSFIDDSSKKGHVDTIELSSKIRVLQGGIKDQLSKMYESLEPSKNPLAKHPLLVSLRSEIAPDKLEKPVLYKPSEKDLIKKVIVSNKESVSMIIKDADLTISGNTVTGTVTFGAMKKDN